MKRRDFLQSTVLGAAALTVPATACTAEKSSNATDPTAEATNWNDFPLLETDIATLRADMEEGRRSAKEITQLYLDRIQAIDVEGPALNSIIEVNPDALGIAEELDRERAEGKVRGPLHGIPVVIKDNIDTADKMKTTAGSLALQDNVAQQDAFIVEKLRAAGMVLLAKANLSEWANFRSTQSSSGWSSRGGQTRNPYILDRNPCGSSSGSAAAVSANLVPLAIGTETNGSIVCPSSVCGIVGIKPTVGLWSRSGIIPISETQDTAGPMARNVRDAAAFLGVCAGIDPRDARTQDSRGNSHEDYTQFCDANALQGARLGVYRDSFSRDARVVDLMESALAVLEKAGATLIELEELTPEGLGGYGYEVLLYEFKDGLNRYLAQLPAEFPIKSLEDVIAYNEQHAEEVMPFFQQEIHINAQERGDLNSPEYKEALRAILQGSRENGIDKAVRENKLDAIVGLTRGVAWPIDLINGDSFKFGGGSSSPAARAGYPNITVPLGYIHDLPAGISFFGQAWTEPKLIGIAYAYEQLTQHRQAPKFIESSIPVRG